MTLLVTGSDGLVGSALRELIKSDVFFATRHDADLTSFDETKSLMLRIKPRAVVHLAALVGGIGGNLMKSGDYFRKNLLINANVLEAARIAGVNRLISYMSTCVFPDGGPYPLDVGNLHNGQPHESNFGYAYAKRMLEVQSRAYRAQWGLNYIVAIPTNVYGPHDNFSLTEGHVVPALIHKVQIAQSMEKPLVVWGSGAPLREFIYSHDVARLTLWMLDNYFESEPLILSAGSETTIRELVELVIDRFGYKGEVFFDKNQPEGQYRKPSNRDPLVKFLPDFEFTSLEVGLDETISWFRGNYPEVRM